MAIHSYGITKEQIEILFNLIDNGRTTASIEKLREWFPAAFEPEWEEVPAKEFYIFSVDNQAYALDSHTAPFRLIKNENRACDYKIEDGRIWRRKS